MTMNLNIAQTRQAVEHCFSCSPALVPLIQGPPGLGKSDMIKAIAKDANLMLIDVRLAQCEPNDLLGYPQIVNGRTEYIPMNVFPLKGDELPINPDTKKPYDGFILFLDELRNANIHVQQAAYRIILDREVGNYPLHENCLVAAAGNREEDGCFIPPMPSALKSRMIHLSVGVDKQEWLEWAVNKGIDPRITTYIQYKPQSLQTEYADSKEASYGCPRTWEFTSRIIEGKSDKEIQSNVIKALVQGTISEPVALDFYTYIKYFDSVAKYSDVVKNPSKANCPEPTNIGLIWATIGSLSGNFKVKDLDSVLTYIERLPNEYQMVFMKDISKRNPNIISLPSMTPWISKIANVLWG